MKYCTAPSTVSLPPRNGSSGSESYRLEEDFEQVARDALDRVLDGQDVDALAVLDILARVHRAARNQRFLEGGVPEEQYRGRGSSARWNSHNVAEADADVVADDCGGRQR